MAEKQPDQSSDGGPSLELPSFGFGRKRRRKAGDEAAQRQPEPDTGQAPAPTHDTPAPRHEKRPACATPEREDPAPAPTQGDQLVEESVAVAEDPGAPTDAPGRRLPELPDLGPRPAAIVTGVLVGVLTVGATWVSMRLCELVRGTPSCGDPGFLLLLAVAVAMVLVGRLLLGITVLFVVLAVVSPWLAPYDPAATPLLDKVRPQSNPVPGPEPGHPLGADDRGRDLLSRLLVGSRQTLIVGVLATLFGFTGGGVLGTLAGALGGWVDSLVMRMVDVMLSIPSLLLAFSIAAIAARPSQWTVIIAIAVVQVPIFARLLRGSMLAQRSSDHVLAARALGVRPRAIVFRHMLPNALGPVIVQATLVLATAIIDAAALSFLGLGNPDDRQPEWGQMLGRAQTYIAEAPHLAFYPAACIIVVALGFTLMGESLREALDPKSRR